MDVTMLRRRDPYGSPSEYNPLRREFTERGIDACLAVNPLGSVELRDNSIASPQTMDLTRAANGSSFWNDNWRSTEDDRLLFADEPAHERPTTTNDVNDDGIAFFPPRKWGERNVNLSAYWTTRYGQASAVLAVTLSAFLIFYRLAAATLVVGSYSVFWTVPYVLSLFLVSFSHCSIYLRDYVQHSVELNTRFQVFVSIFSLPTAFEWAKFAIGGGVVSWMFAAQLGSYYQWPFLFSGDLSFPDRHAKYLNEEHFYVVLSGAWCGTVLFLRRHFDFTRPRIRFPVIQCSKLLDFKARARPSLKKALKSALWPVLAFTVAYHLVLSDLKHLVVRSSLFLDAPTLEIDKTWFQMFNLRRFVVVFLSATMTAFSFRMGKFLTRLFVLAPREFTVELFHEEQESLSLSEALCDSRVPLVRALAIRYLLSISRGNDVDSKDRRRKIYSLNPTGDVPAEWRAVRSDCLSLIDRFSSELDRFSGLAASDRKWPYDGVFPKQLALQAMRLKLQKERLVERRQTMSRIERVRFELRQFLGRLPGLNYVFDDEKAVAFDRTVRDSQSTLYAVRALSCLVAKSVAEDKYGVVQRDVPQILSSMTALKSKLSSLRRLSPYCSAYSVFVHRSLVRIWLAFPDSFGAEGLHRPQ